jgi:ankyrin repeat protein
MSTEYLNIPADDSRAIAAISAIQTGDVEALESLLRENPELAKSRIVDACGVSRTLPHIAADWPGHFPNGARTVAALVSAGADLNAALIHPEQALHQETPLHWAASSDDVVVLDALLDGGADIEAPGAIFTGGTAMSDAVVFGQWKAARRLLERGAQTTLWQAAALGVLDRVKEYCEAEAPLSAEAITHAFWNACHGGQRQTAEYLLGVGAEINWLPGWERRTPLDAAIRSGADELAEWLRGRGAKSAEELD